MLGLARSSGLQYASTEVSEVLRFGILTVPIARQAHVRIHSRNVDTRADVTNFAIRVAYLTPVCTGTIELLGDRIHLIDLSQLL